MLQSMRKVADQTQVGQLDPFTRKGGPRHNHDHRTKKGMYSTLCDMLRQSDVRDWSIQQEHNPCHWKLQMQRDGVLERIANELKPRMVPSTDVLDSGHIQAVGRQLEHAYPSFGFLGVYEVTPEDQKRLLDTYNRVDGPHKRSLGLVLNSSGNHWVTIYIHKKRKRNVGDFEYFDPIGNPPSDSVTEFLADLRSQRGHDKYREHSTCHQKRNRECGTYCLWYLKKRLQRHSFSLIARTPVDDRNMHHYRRRLFYVK